MPGTRPNPTASRRALAARLRRMRMAAGRSTEDAARELMVSASKISRLESGERMPQARDVRDLARYYGAVPEDLDHLQRLVSEARRKGWWEDYSTEDEQGELYLGLETAASRLDMFENLRWPGLLQTREMTRVLLEHLRPPGEFSPQFIDDQVAVRQKRQERLVSGELFFHIVLDEAMFHRPMGQGAVERQVERIIDLVDSLTNLVVQAVPFAAGPYPGLDGTFHILSYPDDTDLEETVFVEGLRGNTVIERPAMVERYRTIFKSISSQNALSASETREWLERFV